MESSRPAACSARARPGTSESEQGGCVSGSVTKPGSKRQAAQARQLERQSRWRLLSLSAGRRGWSEPAIFELLQLNAVALSRACGRRHFHVHVAKCGLCHDPSFVKGAASCESELQLRKGLAVALPRRPPPSGSSALCAQAVPQTSFGAAAAAGAAAANRLRAECDAARAARREHFACVCSQCVCMCVCVCGNGC